MDSNATDLVIGRGSPLMEAEVDGEMVGLHIESGTCYGFNGTAYRIWQLVEQPRSLTALCEALAQEFDVDPATCRSDVTGLIDELAQDGLLTLSRGR